MQCTINVIRVTFSAKCSVYKQIEAGKRGLTSLTQRNRTLTLHIPDDSRNLLFLLLPSKRTRTCEYECPVCHLGLMNVPDPVPSRCCPSVHLAPWLFLTLWLIEDSRLGPLSHQLKARVSCEPFKSAKHLTNTVRQSICPEIKH